MTTPVHPYRWWMPTDRTVTIVSPLGKTERMAIPADAVFCDICGDVIPFSPVPVCDGDALCAQCFERMYGITVGEAARRDGIEITSNQ